MSRGALIGMITGLALAATACVQPGGAPAPAAEVEKSTPPPTERKPAGQTEKPTADTEAETAAPKTGKVTRMPLGTLFGLQQTGGALIIDVRPAFVHRLGHIPGSVNWPKSNYEARLAAMEPQIRAANLAKRPVVLYCTDLACPDARDVATRLAGRGHTISVLEGGWDAWKAGGLPTE